jgi:hypothetical protein
MRLIFLSSLLAKEIDLISKRIEIFLRWTKISGKNRETK